MRQPDFSIVADLVNFDFDALAFVHDFAWVADARPTDFTDVDQAFCTAQINKRAKVHQLAHDAFADLANFQFFHQYFALLLHLALEHRPVTEDQFSFVRIALDDNALQFLVDELLHVFYAIARDLAGRNKSANRSQRCLEATGVGAGDFGVHNGAFFDFVPIRDVDRCAGDGQLVEPVFLVAAANGNGQRLAFGRWRFERVQRSDALALASEFDEYVVFEDFCDRSLNFGVQFQFRIRGFRFGDHIVHRDPSQGCCNFGV